MTGEASVDAAWHHIADANVVVAMIEHHGFGKSVKAEFRGVIGRPPGEWIFSGKAADINDPAVFTLPKPLNCGAAAVERARQVHRDDAIPLFYGQISGRTKNSNAGVVDQDVETFQLVIGECEKIFNLLAV